MEVISKMHRDLPFLGSQHADLQTANTLEENLSKITEMNFTQRFEKRERRIQLRKNCLSTILIRASTKDFLQYLMSTHPDVHRKLFKQNFNYILQYL